jgi:prophage maintenance system killer protein
MPSVDDAEHAMLRVASGEWRENEMAAWLREHLSQPESS